MNEFEKFAGAAVAMPLPASRPAPAVTTAAMTAADRLVRLIPSTPSGWFFP
jgi:hypothetical protein